jgi:CrcB protein
MSPANHPRKIQERVPKEGERRVSFGKKDRNGMTKYWMVALGGAVGSVLRFWVGGNVADRLGTRFPYGTFAVNITGSFLIGLVLTVVSERVNVNPNWRYLIGVGFIGGYTTFSAFEYETFQSMQAIGLICVWLGVAAARALD